MFYLDVEIIEQLRKEKNMSSIINSYLHSFYKINNKKEEIKETIKIKEKDIEELKELDKQLKNKEKEERKKQQLIDERKAKLEQFNITEEKLKFINNSINWQPKDKLSSYNETFSEDLVFSQYIQLEEIAEQFR